MSGQSLAQRHHDVGMTQGGPSRSPRGGFHAEEAGCRQDRLSTSISALPSAGTEACSEVSPLQLLAFLPSSPAGSQQTEPPEASRLSRWDQHPAPLL